MLDRLGPVVSHETPTQAMAALELLEETARLRLLSGRQALPVEQKQIEALRQRSNARW